MEVYLSIDDIGRAEKPQNKFEIIETRKRTAGKWQKTDIGKAARLIGAMGHTVIPGHLEGGTKACNCTAMQVFMLDFDDGIRYTEIEGRCKELGIPISFAYHTFSSTEKKEKFRIAFAHESLIADPYIIKITLCMLMQIFPESDRACSNLDRMFYGGKELICLNENAHFALVQLTLLFYRSLDINKNFSRNVESFARKHQILLYNGRLAMGNASFYQDFIKDMKNDGNRVSAIIHLLGESPFPSFCMVEGSVNKRHQSIRCRQEIKNLRVKEGMGCRLLDDFLSGADMSHNQRLALLTNLMQVKGGRKLFFEAMERYYEPDSVEKWKQYTYYMKGYKPQRCSGQFCPYYGQCANAGTVVDTLMRDRKVYRKDTVYHTLEEAEDCMRGNLYAAYHACSPGIHLVRAQTGIGKTTAYIELVRKEKGAKFIIAVPTIMLKEEVYRRLIKAGIPAEEIFLTRNIRGNPLIPREIQERVEAAHNRGEHDMPRQIVRDYYNGIREDGTRKDTARECRLYLEGMQALQGERVVVTTHAYFVNMPGVNLQDYTAIIDEDILQLYFLKQLPSAGTGSLQALEKSGIQPYAWIAGQMLHAQEGEYRRVQGTYRALPLGMEELERLGCTDGSNVNDIIRAGAFVKIPGKDGGSPYIRYFCPGKLPKAKYIVLSATVNEKMYREYFRDSTEVHSYPYLQAGYRGKLVQYTYHSLGRQDLRKKKQVFSYAKKAAGDEKVEMVSFKEAAAWEEMRGNNRSGIHFGNSTGVNTLEGQDLVVIGTPYSIPEAYKLVACYLGSDMNREADKAPKMRSAEEVIAYLEKLRLIIQYLGASDCKLQEGSMRTDVNLSVREAGAAQFGTRTEMKNLNSFKAISRAIAGETERQIDLIESGGKVVQETRRWDDIKGESYAMRSKEDAQDYRYFPDPDLTPVAVSDEMLEQIRARQPEFRNEKRKRYREEFEIPAYDIEIITGSKHMADLFEAATAICGQPKKVSNWLMGETMRLMKETETDAQDLRFSPENLAKLIGLVDARVINGSVAKEVFEVMFEENMDPEQYVEEKGLKTVNDEGALRRTIEEVIAANPQSVEDYKNGKEKAIGFLVGQTMKAMKGKADPAAVNQIIREACGK